MKKLSNVIVACAMASAISAYGGNCYVTFNLDGITADSAKIIVVNFLKPNDVVNKSVAVVDGKAVVDISADATNMIVAGFESADGGRSGEMVRVIAIPDCPMTVTVTQDGHTIGGAPEYVSIRNAQETVGSKMGAMSDSALCERVKNYIVANPDEVGSAFIACDLGAGILEVDSLLSDRSKSVLHGYYDYFYDKHNAPLVAKRNADRCSEGAQAPDFTLKDINGGTFTLSSLRGKTVILDFWGSWCVPCLKSIPRLKEQYARYKDKGLEIVSVACSDTDEAWRAAVNRTGMNWVNLLNDSENNDITKVYGIGSFPTMFIISPDGVIVRRTAGENEDFFNHLQSLMQ
ncbi:MAG: TlpA family protein disulfide reductase [Lachnospiraceae bacterium]|nr:TlpA family protein disulfide reductase [Lachnospiraceae bacterium]